MIGLTALTCSPSPVWQSGFTGSNLVAVDSAWLVGWDWLPWEQANSAGPGLAGRGETGITGSGETDFAGRSGSGFNVEVKPALLVAVDPALLVGVKLALLGASW